MSQNVGKVSQIIGPVVDVSFDSSSTELPNIYDSLEVNKDDGSTLVLEVQSHVGEDMVRTISMDSTDGLQRGAEVLSTGNPIQMPIGKDIYGRLFNVIGDAIDGMEDLPKSGGDGLPIHREAPHLSNSQHQQKYCSLGLKLSILLSHMQRVEKLDCLVELELVKQCLFKN